MPANPTGTPDLLEMYAANRRFWDEMVAHHTAPDGYDLSDLRRGEGHFGDLVERELASVSCALAGKRVIHLQCHFGADTLIFAQRGATVVGVDFSPVAIETARALASELRLTDRAEFVLSDVYAAPLAVGAAESFDLAFVTWGTIGWLPDIRAWAEVVAGFLKPGGRLYLAEGHPSAYVFDDKATLVSGLPGYFAPYFEPGPIAYDDDRDYANPSAQLESGLSYSWLHPLSAVVMALLDAGLTLRFLHEHDGVPWPMFRCLVRHPDEMFRWPDRPWLPLSFSLAAEKPR